MPLRGAKTARSSAGSEYVGGVPHARSRTRVASHVPDQTANGADGVKDPHRKGNVKGVRNGDDKTDRETGQRVRRFLQRTGATDIRRVAPEGGIETTRPIQGK